MNVNIKVFGMLSEVFGADEIEFNTTAKNTNQLKAELEKLYMGLSEISCKYAVNNELSNESQPIHEGSNIAIFPPFSGG